MNTICTFPLDCDTPTTRMLYPLVLETLIIPSINETNFSYQLKINTLQTQTIDCICHPPAHNRHRDMLQPAETNSPYSVCAIDLTATFDTVYHDTLLSKISRSSLPTAITRYLSCYLRGRQAANSFRGRTGVPQVSKLSPSLFNYYIADMPRPTPRSRGYVTLTTSQYGALDQISHNWSP